jgi:hypothetical protein
MDDNKYYIVYKITNKINNKIYIGVHITTNINDKYFGSGSNIRKAIKEFGKENFEKIILFNCNSKEEMLEKEKELVNEEFIKRKDTYNIILGGNNFNTENIITVKDKYNNYYSVHKTDSRYLSGELNSIHINKFLSKSITNDIFFISNDDPRYLSGELIAYSKDTISVKDKNGNNLRVHKNDSRYLSGELIHNWVGKKHTVESKNKISIANKINQKGIKNSQYGTCWIFNTELKENKKIHKDELIEWINSGWVKGRKIKI